MSLEKERFEFGEYVLSTNDKVLLRDGKPIAIPPKILELLIVLVKSRGNIVGKEDLMNRLWADAYVEDSNLTFSIRRLRTILGDDTHNPRFIETVPKRGYRFIADTQSGRGRIADESSAADGNVYQKPAAGNRTAATHVGRSRSYFGVVVVVSVILIGAATLAVWWFYFGRSRTPSLVKIERLTYNGKVGLAAVSPDGRFAAYVVDDAGNQTIWLKNVATGSDVQILPAAAGRELYGVFFSGDHDHVYYVAGDTLYQLPLLGGTPKAVLENFGTGSQSKSIAQSADGERFAFVRPTSSKASDLVVINSDGTGERVVASSPEGRIFRRSVVWSPDGKSIALVSAGAAGITVIDAATGSVSFVHSPPWRDLSQIVWRRDGKAFFVLAAESRDLYQVWHISYPDEKAEKITNDFNNYQSIGLTEDGETLTAVRVEQSAHIWAADIENIASLKQLTHGIEGYDGIYALDYLSNGTIVYETSPGERNQVWSIDVAAGSSKLMLGDTNSSGASPDGKYIVYKSGTASEPEGLFRFDTANGEKKRLTIGKDTWITFSPDSKSVVFTRWERDASVWRVPIDGGEAIKLTNIPEGYAMAPSVAPDGRSIAFYWAKRTPRQPPEIAIIPFDGGSVVKTFPIPEKSAHGYAKHALQWSNNGRSIDYAVFRDNASNIWRQPLDGRPAFPVTNFTDQQIFNFAYSTDGRKLALSRGTYGRDVVLLKLK